MHSANVKIASALKRIIADAFLRKAVNVLPSLLAVEKAVLARAVKYSPYVHIVAFELKRKLLRWKVS